MFRVNATVAQLDRVLGYEPSGQGFESLQLHQMRDSRKSHNKKRLGKPSPFLLLQILATIGALRVTARNM